MWLVRSGSRKKVSDVLIFIFQGPTRGKKYPSLYLPLSEGFDNHKIKKILFFYDFLKFFENAMLFFIDCRL